MKSEDQSLNRPTLLKAAAHLQVAVNAFVKAVQAKDRSWAGRYGLSASQLHGLLTLNGKGPFTVTCLGNTLHLEKSTASRLAKGLIKLGLARKRPSGSDDRRVILQVTEKGMRLSRKILNDLSGEYVELLASMEHEGRETLPTLLDELTRGFSGETYPSDDPGPAEDPFPPRESSREEQPEE